MLPSSTFRSGGALPEARGPDAAPAADSHAGIEVRPCT